mmetsp:Transcript_48800/g.86940  ORF Transcript_48800/g.86940 Transcript_48800/m.86940 type:complete len:85 (+) Transcript_48800:1187-1441(+)
MTDNHEGQLSRMKHQGSLNDGAVAGSVALLMTKSQEAAASTCGHDTLDHTNVCAPTVTATTHLPTHIQHTHTCVHTQNTDMTST